MVDPKIFVKSDDFLDAAFDKVVGFVDAKVAVYDHDIVSVRLFHLSGPILLVEIFLAFRIQQIYQDVLLINVFLDDAKMKIIEGAGLAGQVKDLGGKKAVQVPLGEKEQKELFISKDIYQPIHQELLELD